MGPDEEYNSRADVEASFEHSYAAVRKDPEAAKRLAQSLSQTQPMKIGILGLGSIGTRHARNLMALGHEVIGYDPQKPPSLEMQRILASREEVIAASQALISASPTPHHLKDALVAIKTGKPVLIEKPILDKMPDHMVRDLLRGDGVYVGNMLRFHPCVRRAALWMKRIGAPYRATFTLSQKTEKPTYVSDGVILNWGSHEVDLATYLLGEAEVQAAYIRTTFKDDLADIILTHNHNGCHSTIHLDFVGIPEERGFTIYGEGAQIKCNLTEGQVYFISPDTAEAYNPETSWNDIYREEMQAFIEAVEGKKTYLATGKDGLDTLALLLAARGLGMK